MVKKDITINDLAVMVQKGFAETATKAELKSMKAEIDKRLDSMVTKAEMNRRFDGLEDRVLASHQKRIEKLEAEVKELRAMFAA
ncbi:MAG: hypothetical protein ABSA74_03230 [Candidatus Staskawiczbacteria bacterium]|jgi:hypothetical protein